MKLLLFFFLLVPAIVWAQPRTYSTKSNEALKWYATAKRSVDMHLLQQASNQLDQAIAADGNFIEAWYMKGDINRLLDKDEVSAQAYEKVIALKPGYDLRVYLLAAEAQHGLGKYDVASNYLKKFSAYDNPTPEQQEKARKLTADCDFASMSIKSPVEFKPVNIGAEINSVADEYLPVVTADEGMMIFTRREKNNEDFYQSNHKNSKWTKAVPLSARINTPQFNEGAQSISQDGQYLFFTGCNRPDGLGRCDIFLSKKNGDVWDKPYNLGAPINTSGWESQPCISADGRTLYFVSNRKGGYGGYDIWKSTVSDKGWNEPENLGPIINTRYNEQSPFIHPDGTTLYFCSDGWPGMGKSDLFISRFDEKRQWKKPENLGYPINSNGEENGLTITTNGRYAYFASNKLQGKGGYDIYSFELPEKVRPTAVTYVKGIIRDAKSNEPIITSVKVTDLATGQSVYDDFTSENGEFLATLLPGRNYGLIIEKEAYLFHSENFAPLSASKLEPYIIDIKMNKIAIGSKEKLSNVFFDTNSFVLKSESKTELEKLVSFMQLNPKVSIEIGGHTDDIGDNTSNQKLSENRAKAVFGFLTGKINPARLKFTGYGETQPLIPNSSEKNRQLNRRTEFKVTAY